MQDRRSLLPSPLVFALFVAFVLAVCLFFLFCDLPLAEASGSGKETVMRCRRKLRHARRYATGCLAAALSAGAPGK